MGYKKISIEKWGGETYTAIPITIEYDLERNAADMRYKIRLTLGALNNGHYFNISIRTDISFDGVLKIENKVLKDSSPSSWSNPIVWESDWITVSGKTTGTTALSLRVFAGNWQSGGRDATYAYSLPILPAASDFSVGAITIGSQVTVQIDRRDPGFTHTVDLSFAGASVQATGAETSAELTVPMDWCSSLPNAAEGSGTMTVITYSGATEIGRVIKAVRLLVPASVVPTVSISVDGTYDLGGLYVQGKTRLTITASHAGSYGSAIVAVNIKGAGYSGNTDVLQTGELNVTGDVDITALITDTRGRTATASITITVLAYSRPVLSVTSCYRCDADGNATESGTYLNAKASFSCSTLNGHNAISCGVSYRKKGAAWSGETAILPDIGKVVFGEIAATDAYEVRFRAIDSIGESAESIVIINSSANYLITAVRGKIALGGYVDQSKDDGVQVFGDLFVRGYSILDYIRLSGIAPNRNLLDNSDFRNPVNQRGLQEYTSDGYSIDRWIFEKSGNGNALLVVQRVEDGFPEDRISLQVGSGFADFYQNLENYDKIAGKIYTLAVNINGVVYTQVFTMGSISGGISLGNDGAVFYSTPSQHVLIRSTTAPGFNMLWMALYEGEFTAETMPEYHPKGYGAELAECIRYYRKSYDGNNIKSVTGVVSIKPANANWLCTVNFDTPMRAVPTITLYSPVTGKVGCVSDFHTDADTETVSVTATKRNFAILLYGGFNEDHSYYFNYEASADI